MTTGSHSEPCINWPCAKGAGHVGPCGTSPDERSSVTRLYSYDATTQVAKVYHRTTGAVVCEVSGVSLYIGNLLSKLADEMYWQGHEKGRLETVNRISRHLNEIATRG